MHLATPVQCHPVGVDFQRHHHSLPDSSGDERRQVPPHVFRENAGPKYDDLLVWAASSLHSSESRSLTMIIAPVLTAMGI
ncbi:MAG: hypothetical protein ACLU9S_03485 [Oscillospiraceae bacterium]